jgi:YVTN family beta-propeller protein
MRLITMKRHFCVSTLSILLALPLPAASTTRIWVLNNNGEGKQIQIINSATNKIVQTIEGIRYPHGVAFSPDGKLAYVVSEDEQATNALWVIDTKTWKILKSAPLSAHRGNVPAITKDGKLLFICVQPPRTPDNEACASATSQCGGPSAGPPNGALDLVDTATLKVIKSLPYSGHDCYTTPDEKYFVAGAGRLPGGGLLVIDAKTFQEAWRVPIKEGMGPIAFLTNPDGSTRTVLVTPLNQRVRQIAVVDFATHKEVNRITLPKEPGKFEVAAPLTRRTPLPVHGFAISPDKKTLAIGVRDANAVYFYSLPDLKPQGYFATPVNPSAKHPADGGDPGWLTYHPDGKTLYVASAAADVVSVVDTKTLKELVRIPVGKQPDHVWTQVIP